MHPTDDPGPPQDFGTSPRRQTAERVMAALGSLTLHKQNSKNSLHKPLTLLWAMGQLAARVPRLHDWQTFRAEMRPIFATFGSADVIATPEDAFFHLASESELWEAWDGDVPLEAPPSSTNTTARAGFTEEVADILSDSRWRALAIHVICSAYLSHMPDHEPLLARLGLAPKPHRWDAAAVVTALIGVPLTTLDDEPVTLVAANAHRVVVETQSAPEGIRVPLMVVQDGLDQLWADGVFPALSESLGQFRPFVGAILAALPDARAYRSPARVSLDITPDALPKIDTSLRALDIPIEARYRLEQESLRRNLVGGRDVAHCALCGHEFPVTFLVAAHIKQRARCTDEERRDLTNVAMLACTFGCDTLYELGYVTVAADGVIQTSPYLGIGASRFSEHLDNLRGRRCEAHRQQTEPYFAWHRTSKFRGGPDQDVR